MVLLVLKKDGTTMSEILSVVSRSNLAVLLKFNEAETPKYVCEPLLLIYKTMTFSYYFHLKFRKSVNKD